MRRAMASLLFFGLALAQPSRAESMTVAFFGDSITRTGVTLGTSYPDLFALATGAEVINLGISGETTYSGLTRFEQGISTEPEVDLVILLEGTNDLFRSGYDEGRTAENVLRMAELASTAGIEPIIATPLPILKPGAHEQNDRARGLVLALSIKGLGVGMQVVDLYEEFESRMTSAALLLNDGLHPNPTGRALIASTVEASLVIVPEPSTILLVGLGIAAIGVAKP